MTVTAPAPAAARPSDRFPAVVIRASTTATRPASPRLVRTVAAAFALLAAIAYGATLPDYGLVSDEANYLQSSRRLFGWGHLFLDGLRAGDPGRAFTARALDDSWRWGGDRIPHPPLARLLGGVSGAALFGHTDPLVAYRLAGVLVAAALAGAVAAWGARLGGWAAGVGAGGAFLLMPRLFAHAHFAGTDVLLAALFLASLLWAAESQRAPMAGAGVLWGLALATKFSAVLLLPVLIAWLWVFDRGRLRRLPAFLAAAALAFAAVNPALWVEPEGTLREYVHQGLQRRDIPMAQLPTLYFDRLYTFRPPWHYAPVMLLFTTPLGILLLAGCGAAAGLHRRAWRPAAGLALLVPAAFLAALAMPAAPLHDDVRLLLPALPFIALLAGLGCAALLRAGRGPAASARWARAAVPLVLALALGESLLAHTRMHPYQASYFNALVGGISGAGKRGLEVTTMKEVLNRDTFHDLNRILAPGAVLDGGPFLFEDLMFARDVAGWLRADVQVVPPAVSRSERLRGPEADYVLIVNRGGWLRAADRALLGFARPAYELRVADVPLLALYRLR